MTKDEAGNGINTANVANGDGNANNNITANANANSNASANQLAGVARQQDLQTRQMPLSQVATFDAVRSSVKNSGYDIAGIAGAGSNPLVLVVNTPNAPQTNQTVAKFLNSAGDARFPGPHFPEPMPRPRARRPGRPMNAIRSCNLPRRWAAMPPRAGRRRFLRK